MVLLAVMSRRTDAIMAAVEWDVCTDAQAMLRSLRGRTGNRKLRLVACACARARWSGLRSPECQRGVEVAERCADDEAEPGALRAAEADIFDACFGGCDDDPEANRLANACVGDLAAEAAAEAVACFSGDAPAILREIFGNPFRELKINDQLEPLLADGRLRSLAQRAYDERRFEGLPELAALLRQAGLEAEGFLSHLQSPGPHFRGCWALDAMLGKGHGRAVFTEAEWRAETHPFLMLRWWRTQRDELSPRKYRLLACACCRLIGPRFVAQRCEQAITIAEACADDATRHDELARVHEQLKHLCASTGGRLGKMSPGDPAWDEARDAWLVSAAAMAVTDPDPRLLGNAMHYAASAGAGRDTEDAAQAELVREVLGNPFRPPAIDATWRRWRSGAIPELSRTIYRQRSFQHLPLLGDMLESAGCDDPEILSHCRGAGPHVRGCWVLDAILDDVPLDA